MAMTCEKVRELAPGFVLGALETEEMIAVQDHLDGCDLHAEIDELGGVVPYLAQAVPPAEPPAWLRESVIAAAKADARARQRVGKGTEHRLAIHVPAAQAAQEPIAAPAVSTPAAATVISFRSRAWSRRRQIAAWSTRIAAALLVVGLGTYAVSVQDRLNHPASPTLDIPHVIQVGTRVAALTSSDTSAKAPGGLAVLQQTGHVLMNIYNLPATAGDQVYVVWVTTRSVSDSEIGWFTADSTGRVQVEFPNVPNAPNLFLYVTLEPNSHVTKPSGATVVSGTLSS